MPNTVRCPQPPGSTYRLQLTADFGFGAAAQQAGYLARLGVTHVYLSPILQAVPGSRHGYDVTDHSRVSADLGGEDGFRAMVAAFRSAGLGVVVDIVPNHMAIPAPETLNHQLWSVLRSGPGSEYAHWFDIDWDAGNGRMLLPILTGDPPGGLTADGDVLRYSDHVLPLREGTQRLPMPRLLDAQHYRLAHWRDAATQLNWRRFFDITTLIGLRAEDPRVFGATHEVIVRLAGEGLIDGLRVDHPDGLADPGGYLRRLAEDSGVWVVAEKILAPWENLPEDWACAGTTGYDTLALVDGLFLDPDGEEPLNSEYARFTGNKAAFAAVARDAKREVARASFAAEMSHLARLLAVPAADGHEVLAELAACLGVYRAYVTGGQAPPRRSVTQIGDALAAAKSVLPARLHGLADAARDAALGTGPAEFAVRFGQLTAPVQAKGVEDTACYRWSRLVCLNEVGADPGRLGVSVATFHAEASRLANHWPATMTTLSTHDTKRAEDVRARLAVLAERPGEWAEAVAAWHLLMPESPLDPDTEYLLWQTLVGAWPIEGGRLSEYLTKAMREAKTRTSWTDPDPAYESAAQEFAARARQVAPVGDFVSSIAPDARVNSLGAKLVQLTMPGVPDVYQGCELESLALVDPDNRRAVDFARRHELLDSIDHPDNSDQPDNSVQPDKLVVTTRALRLRRDNPGWFAGSSYTPLRAQGPAAGHVVAFARGANAVTVATRLPAGLRRRGGWADTALPLPAAPGRSAAVWTDVLTGAEHEGPRPSLAALTRRLPVALLTPR